MPQIAIGVCLVYFCMLIFASTSTLPCNHKAETSTPLANNSNTTTPEPVDEMEMDEMEGVEARAAAQVSVATLLKIIDNRKLVRCVCQLICELTCNPDIYGAEGKKVYDNFKAFENTTVVDPDIDQFRLAKALGDKYNPGRTCGLCDGDFPNCTTPHKAMIQMATQLHVI